MIIQMPGKPPVRIEDVRGKTIVFRDGQVRVLERLYMVDPVSGVLKTYMVVQNHG